MYKIVPLFPLPGIKYKTDHCRKDAEPDAFIFAFSVLTADKTENCRFQHIVEWLIICRWSGQKAYPADHTPAKIIKAACKLMKHKPDCQHNVGRQLHLVMISPRPVPNAVPPRRQKGTSEPGRLQFKDCILSLGNCHKRTPAQGSGSIATAANPAASGIFL